MVKNSLIAILLLLVIFFIIFAQIKAEEAQKENFRMSENLQELEVKVDSLQQELVNCQ